MFFLKELPTDAMVSRYGSEYSVAEVEGITSTLKELRKYSLLTRKLDEYFTSHNLSQLRFLVMMVIDRELDRNCLYAYEIADRLDVSKPVLSRAIKKLLEDALLSATKDLKDSRAVSLSLTLSGQKLLKSILPDYFLILTGKEI